MPPLPHGTLFGLALVLLLPMGCQTESPRPTAPAVDPNEARRQAEALYTPPSAGDGKGSGVPAEGIVPAAVSTEGGATLDVDPVPVVLVWDGISNLHQSFFADPAIVTALSAGLTGEVLGPANIYIRYDSTNFRGSIRLQLRPDSLARKPRRDGEVILLQDLAPITTALAAYRSAVASRKDYRIESFRVGIESFRGPRACIFDVAGRPPPDGRLVSPCVQVNGREECGAPGPEGVRFQPAVAGQVAACLDL